MKNDDNTQAAANTVKPRLWPALTIVLVGLFVSISVDHFASTNMESIVGLLLVPMVATLLIVLWWLFASRVPRLDRFIGLIILAVIMSALYVTQSVNAEGILGLAAPYLTYGVVIVFTALRSLTWKAQRWPALAYLIVCAVVFGAMRVDTIGGDLAPVVHWRWEAGVEQAPMSTLSAESPGGIAALPDQLGPGD